MKLQIYSIHDSVAEAFLPPFFLPNNAMAIRTFASCINDDNHQFGRHPHDYTLFHLGDWDDQDAKASIIPCNAIGNGVEYVQRPEHTDQPDLQGIK